MTKERTKARIGRVIIVDDEAELMSTLCEMLMKHGYETAGFASSVEALEALKGKEFDILLADLMMPGINGIELIRAGIEIDPNLVPIIITGQGTVQSAVEAMKVGAFDYILKPFKMGALSGVLSRAMKMRHLRLENMHLREIVAIHELAKTIAFPLDANSILQKVIDAVLEQFNADEASIMLLARDGTNELYVAAAKGADHEWIVGTRVSMESDSVAGWAARNQEPVALYEGLNDPRFAALNRDDIQSAVSMPMLAGGNLIGVLNLNITRGKRPFNQGQIKALSILTSMVAPVIEGSWLYTQLQEVEEKYRLIFDNAIEGIYQITEGGQFIMVNPTFAHMLGYDSAADLVASVPDMLRIYVDPECFSSFKRSLKEQGEVKRFEHKVYRKDGRVVWFSNSARKTDKGDVYCEGFVEDITDRKQNEEEKEAMEAQLRQSQKMEAIGTLASGIAHDFNNILTGIIGFAEMMRDDVATESPLRHKLDIILKGAQRGYGVVRQILAFSRRSEPEKKPVEMGLIIREATKLLRASLPSTIEIREHINTDRDLVFADQVQIHQVILNLCTNAAHAMRDKGGTMVISLTDEPPDHIKLLVRDTGCGMTPELMERVFDPFFTTKKPGEGTGMGLSVVHGIVKRHDGVVSVSSRPGHGSSFSVIMPRLKSTQAAKTEDFLATPKGHERILFVDDEDMIAEMTKERLERLGYEAVVTTSSLEALDIFRDGPGAFDLVITDYTMPVMTGVDLAAELLKIKPDVPIIMCSGLDDSIPKEKIEEIGISKFLRKPLERDEFAKQIRLVLDMKNNLC